MDILQILFINKVNKVFEKKYVYSGHDPISYSQKGEESCQRNIKEYVRKITPTYQLWKQMVKAFFVGGLICVLGQLVTNVAIQELGMDEQQAGGFCSLALIALSVLLTGFHVYSKLVTFAGAGALVPITGFANSVAAPAIEFKKEGWVFGVGCKIFLRLQVRSFCMEFFTSWVLGIIYWIRGILF